MTRLDKRLTDDQKTSLSAVTDGLGLGEIARQLVNATRPEEIETVARKSYVDAGKESPEQLSEEELAAAREQLVLEATAPLMAAEAREAIKGIQTTLDQIIDRQSQDEVTFAQITGRDQARRVVESWEMFIEEHHDEYVALAAYYQQPASQRLSLSDVRELARAIELPPHSLTPARLWAAYERLEKTKVHGSGERKLVDLVSLIRFATENTNELEPMADVVRLRYELWLSEQESAGRAFSTEQRRWLDMVAEHIASSLSIEREDFQLDPFRAEGGLIAVDKLFGTDLPMLLNELNKELVPS